MPYSYFNVSYENLAVCQFRVVKGFLMSREFTAVVIIAEILHSKEMLCQLKEPIIID